MGKLVRLVELRAVGAAVDGWSGGVCRGSNVGVQFVVFEIAESPRPDRGTLQTD